MSNLLTANFIRLKKERVFWVLFLVMAALGILFPVSMEMDETKTGTSNSIDTIFGHYAVFIGIVMAIFCCFFVGKEYSDGTIRNKIISGKKRADIYLANFITCVAVSIIFCCIFLLIYLAIGIPFLGFFTIGIKVVFQFLFTIAALSIAFSSIFNLVAMLSVNKSVTAVICVLLAFSFFFIGLHLNQMLNQPETVLGMTITEDGTEKYEKMPNPDYLNEQERKIVRFVYDYIPGGQAAQCLDMDVANLPMLPAYSIMNVLLTTGIGVWCFKRKDLK